ncbi:hypothetical protein [Fusibacter sp. JL216-2]|uniref:hypothetical protein n=1 Tax=Fusibacter sp. JL216-2 TaxID=3071453 RepID=UPI003D33F26F
MNVTIDNNKIIVGENECRFDHPILDYVHSDGVYIVVLNIPKGTKEIDNVYGVNENGKLIWKIQSVTDAFGIAENTPYISIRIDESDSVVVNNFFGMRYEVDPSDGTLKKKECISW